MGSNEISLPNQVSIALRKDILHTDQPSPESLILFHLINGHTSPHLAAIDLLATVAQAHDPMSLSLLTREIAARAMEYLTLHPQFIALISAVYSLPLSTPQRLEFLGSLSTSIGDLTYMYYEGLYETVPPHQNLSVITRHYIALNAFYARLLSAVGEVQVPQEVIQGLKDALFVISGALENEKTAHNYPNVDVPTAAMYMIHAEKLFFEESMKRYGILAFTIYFESKFSIMDLVLIYQISNIMF